MPTLTIKTASIEKLKAIGCYDEWLANVKAQWGTYSQILAITNNHQVSAAGLLLYGFDWAKSGEGREYWVKLYQENKP